MEYLKTITDEDVFKKRTTVKAVVINDGGEFGFITNPVHGFYLLAGGGAESNNLEKEIQRECDEEINFKVEVLSEIGRVHKYRNRNAKEYETVCFAVKTIKETNKDTRTEDEKKNDLRVVWLDRDAAINVLRDQIEKVEKGKVKFYNTTFNIVRDELFFRTYINTSRED